jgi:hypothetical protein
MPKFSQLISISHQPLYKLIDGIKAKKYLLLNTAIFISRYFLPNKVG